MTSRCSSSACRQLLTIVWLLLFARITPSSASETSIAYKVPNPFHGALHDYYYYIAYSQEANGHEESVEEFFSLGTGTTFSIHEDLSGGKNAPWAILVDGGNGDGKSYKLYDLDKMDARQEGGALDCELDHMNSHKQLFPWKYSYDVSQIMMEQQDLERDNVKHNNGSLTSTIFGVGAIWLNLIKADVGSTLVGSNSPHEKTNSWTLNSKTVKVEMLFEKSEQSIGSDGSDYATAQKLLDQTKPVSIEISVFIPRGNRGQLRRRRKLVENISIKRFVPGVRVEDDKLLEQFVVQLEMCKTTTETRANHHHSQFPSLMRALSSEGLSERAYKIVYVTHKYSGSYDTSELGGTFNKEHHRFMWPYELTNELLSLARNTQTILYDPGFMESQRKKAGCKRLDLFMTRYSETATGGTQNRGPTTSELHQHAASYYHTMAYEDQDRHYVSCFRGEHEPRPKLRLLSSSFSFTTKEGLPVEGRINGLGALLLNAARLHHKSFSLFSFQIQVPTSVKDLNDKRSVEVDVWQLLDKQDKVRVLFYFEKQATENLNSLTLAERDRESLGQLVRIDIRAAGDDDDETTLAVDQTLVDSDRDLLVQYHIFNFEFELDEHEANNYFELPDECIEQLGPKPAALDEDPLDGDSSGENDEGNSVEGNYDEIDEWNDLESDGTDEYDDDANTDPDSQNGSNLAYEYQQLEGLEQMDTPLPDFIEALGSRTSYTITTRFELIDDSEMVAANRTKTIWLTEWMDLATEQLIIKVYLSRESLENHKLPDEQYIIFYESELMFRLTKHGPCERIHAIESANNKWLRLLAGQLNYYVAIPTKDHKKLEAELDKNELVVRSNRLSSYGLGVLWRRAGESGQAEYLGVGRERVNRNGRDYKQLRWLYEEFGMTFVWTFLLEDKKREAAKPQLESVLISSKYMDGFNAGQQHSSFHTATTNFKLIKATVEDYNDQGGRPSIIVPRKCYDELLDARRKIEYEQEIKPPDVEEILGHTGAYELEYSIHKLGSTISSNRRAQSTAEAPVSGAKSFKTKLSLNSVRVKESFDEKLNRARIVIEESSLEKRVEIFIEGNSKRMFLMSPFVKKCTLLTYFGPTFDPVLSMLFTENPNYDPSDKYGLLSLWKKLSQRHAKLRVKQSFTFSGALHEEQVFIIANTKAKNDDYQEVQMHYERKQVVDYEAASFDHSKKTRIRGRHDYKLDRIELRHIRGPMSQMAHGADENDFIRVNILKQQARLSNEWQLPEVCQQLTETSSLDPEGSPSSSALQLTNYDPEQTYANSRSFPRLSDLFKRSPRFHMRSEINVGGIWGANYLVDEFYNGGDVRLRTRAIGKAADDDNCDLVMFLDTLNQFDLSRPLRCQRLFENKASGCLHMSLFDVWLGWMARVETLARLHYGPLTLWKLAEKGAQSSISTELIKTVKLPDAIWTNLKSDESAGDAPEEKFRKQLEHEMDRETWLVKRAKKLSQTSDWSYEMRFVKQKRQVKLDDGRQSDVVEEWHVLEGITAQETQDGEQVKVSIEVINYSQPPDEDKFRKLFRLPEGWNCRRKLTEDTERPFELNWATNSGSGANFNYEASLELLDISGGKANTNIYYENNDDDDDEFSFYRLESPKAGSSEQLPTLVGTYVTSGDGQLLVDEPVDGPAQVNQTKPSDIRLELDIHESVTRFAANGASLNRRLIVDRSRSLEYEMDLISGACTTTTNTMTTNANWRLSFPVASFNGGLPAHTIYMSPSVHGDHLISTSSHNLTNQVDLFKLMFVENFNQQGHRLFFMVNKYVTEREGQLVLHASFEREINPLSLSEHLVGPARIVRKYEHVQGRYEHVAGDDTRRVDFMTSQVYLLSPDKQMVRAILTIRLQLISAASLSELLGVASVSDCFNQAPASFVGDHRLASFTLEYPMTEPMLDQLAKSHSTIAMFKDNLYRNLLSLHSNESGQSLLPQQLDGRARLELASKQSSPEMLRIHFSVLEAPSSVIYFHKQFKAGMSKQLESIAESRILPDLEACSRWCDRLSCLAMSYCTDGRQCHVATKAGISSLLNKTQSTFSKEGERGAILVALSSFTPRPTCTYHYNQALARPQTLSGLRDYLDRVVNGHSDRKQLQALGLIIGSVSTNNSPVVYKQLEPIRFYEATDTFQWQNEDYDDPFKVELAAGSVAGASSNSLSFSSVSGRLQVVSGHYAIWKEQSKFNVDKVEALNGDLVNSKFIIAEFGAKTKAGGCFLECQRNNCLLVTICPNENKCQMLLLPESTGGTESTGSKSAIMSLAALKGKSIIADSAQCSISIRDHLDKFHLFEETRKPAKFWLRLDDYSAQECAAACHLNQAECLSFDMCTFVDKPSQKQAAKGSVCFLQQDHITLDSFNASLLVPSWGIDDIMGNNENTIDRRRVNCAHYSRSMLANFRRVPNVAFGESYGGSRLRGIGADRCAIDCFQDDTCRAFEQCLNPNHHPSQSCYLIRSSGEDNLDWLLSLSGQSKVLAGANSTPSGSSELRDHHQIISSKSCSIYVAKRELMTERLEETLPIHSALDDNQQSFGRTLAMVCVGMMISIMLGTILQTVFIRLTGRPFSLKFRLART